MYPWSCLLEISIHAPTRGATGPGQRAGEDQKRISIHAPTRGATGIRKPDVPGASGFQSTLPQGERRESGSQMCLVHRDFNPRSHKGSDGTDRFIQVRNTISIHAPTRGATTFPPARYGHPGRFQSTLPQGERLKNSVGNRLGMNFNPRSHKGSDRSCGERGQPDIYFNPRSHKGSDPVAWMPLPVPYIFQSTLPQGERLPFLRLEGSQTNFNPRSHKGSDIGALVESGIMTRFQSTLPQGERP